MALSPSSPSPSASSSAVTLPRPGKSILKKPPPPQQSFFSLSRLSRLLPNQPSASTSSSAGATSGPRDANSGAASTSKQAGDATKSDQKDRDAQTLKRAHFFLPALATVYPISSSLPPSTSSTQQEKCIVETREAERRRRVVRGNSIGSAVVDGNGGGGNRIVEDWWTLEKVAGFYKECCAGREEVPHLGIEAALRVRVHSYSRASTEPCDLVLVTLPHARDNELIVNFHPAYYRKHLAQMAEFLTSPVFRSRCHRQRYYQTSSPWNGVCGSSSLRNVTSTSTYVYPKSMAILF